MQRPRQITLVTLLCASLLGCGSLKRFAYEGFNRDERQHPKRVVQALAIEPGMQVADIGAGGGYFTFKLADAVGETGRVYAVDVDDDMISYLEERAREDGYENVTVVRGEFADPLLPDGQIDLIFSSNTYHHIEGRVAYFRGVSQDLAQGGRVAILELREGSWIVPSHYTDREVIVKEMVEAGYTEVASFDFIEDQSFTIFERTGGG